MLRIDKDILGANGALCGNIKQLSETDRGFLSQISDFVEYIAIKAYSNGQDINLNDYDLNVAALKDMQRRGDFRFLYRFHECYKSPCHTILWAKTDPNISCSNISSIFSKLSYI